MSQFLRRTRNFTSGSGRQTSSAPPDTASPELNIDPSSQDGADNSIGSTDYARKCRQLMELYRALRTLGADMIFDLPRVVVIGGQSSGKSSLVEAVSGINVPRDSGTCTRCPMECTMSSDAETWSCSIELRFEFDDNGSPQTPRTEQFGPTIEDKSTVELWIRRAQAAVLSPHRSRSHFINMSEVELKQNARTDTEIKPFSKNVVQVSVRDPEATDLSFVDLPGLIQNADDALIAMVRGLVEHYVKGKNTLIVIAMPTSDDYEMLQAVVLAKNRKADPMRERTIGVLTKPDMLAQGATGGLKRWTDIMEGREHATKHGYYCVRLPDDEQRTRRMSKVEAQRVADNFFNSTHPWMDIVDRSRLGIPNFVASISALLVQLIEKNLPSLWAAVQDELRKCYADISKLPPVSIVQPSTEVMLRVTEFCKDVQAAVFGEKADSRYFVQGNRTLYSKFKYDVLMTTPDLRPFEGSVSSYRSLVVSRTEPRGLGDVRNVIMGSIAWELPRHVPFEATKTLLLQYTSLWKEPTIKCFESVVLKTNGLLEDLLSRHFGQYVRLQKYIGDLTFESRDRCRDDTRVMLEKILRTESNPLFTQNFDSLEDEEKKWYSVYSTEHLPLQRDRASNDRYQRHNNLDAIYFFDDPELDSVELDLAYSATRTRTWGVEDEIKVMANVQAYFQVAYKRIIDSVPLVIEHELNQSFASNLGNTIIDRIFNDTRQGNISLEALVEEDPRLAAKRKDLEDRKTRLLSIKHKLETFLGTDNTFSPNEFPPSPWGDTDPSVHSAPSSRAGSASPARSGLSGQSQTWGTLPAPNMRVQNVRLF